MGPLLCQIPKFLRKLIGPSPESHPFCLSGGDTLGLPLTQEVLGVPIQKAVIQVVAGRNIAVLVEAAVRNTILQLRGIDTYQEFVARHRAAMGSSGD